MNKNILASLFLVFVIINYNNNNFVSGSCGSSCTWSTDVTALNNIYSSMSGSSWTFNSNWASSGGNPCAGYTQTTTSQWAGVVCIGSTAPFTVTEINLGFNNVGGALPTQIGYLSNVTFFNLESNSIGGTIPSQIGTMTSLQTLQMMNNNIGGSIPTQIGKLTGLQKLIIFSNALIGPLPSELGLLVNLQRFQFDGNQITGIIPATISAMTSLIYFSGDNNKMSGVLPAPSTFITMHNSGSLQFFYVANNSFTNAPPSQFAPLPPAVGTGSSAVALNAPSVDVSGNKFYCTLPDSYISIAHTLLIFNTNQFLCTLSGSTNSGYYKLSNTVSATPCTVTDFTSISSTSGYYNQQPSVTITGLGLNLCSSPTDYRVVYFGNAIAPITATTPTSIVVTVPLGVNALPVGQKVGSVQISMIESHTNVPMTKTILSYTYLQSCDPPCNVTLYPTQVAGCNTATGACVCVSPFATSPNRTAGSNQPYCNIIAYPCSPANCNNQGVCNSTSGVCICNANYTGIGCQIKVKQCPAASSGPFAGDPCAATFGHGTCALASGVCICSGTWQQPACATRPCPNDCYHNNGYGNCTASTGICQCISTRTGVDCSVPDIPCANGTYINQPCSGSAQGTCDTTTGKCICNAPWQSTTACSTQLCPGNCNNLGNCNNQTGVCHCFTNHTGPDCSIPDFACPATNGIPCAGNGNCSTYAGVCSCNSPWLPPNCNNQPCPANCNQRGTCDGSTGVCNCFTNWTGPDCSTPNKTCGLGYQNLECSGPSRGTCNTLTGLCSCVAPWLPNSECQFQNCASLRDCSGHGICNMSTGSCICNSGYTAADCSIPFYNCSSKLNCSYALGQGYCDTFTGNCICTGNWKLPNCSTTFCPLGCSGHGTCDVYTGICNCSANYYGSGCETPDFPCPGVVYDNVTFTYQYCNYRGTCDTSNGQCICQAGYTGADCSGIQCPQDCNTGLGWGTCNTLTGVCNCSSTRQGASCGTPYIPCYNNCFNNGFCNNQSGICTCNIGYDYASNCSTKLCNSACNNGFCNSTTGQCQCNAGFSGSSCQIQLKNCDPTGANLCGGHGTCDVTQGICICNLGWTTAIDSSISPTIGQCIACNTAEGFIQNPYVADSCIVPVPCSHLCMLANYSGYASCNITNGLCICSPGYTGVDCNVYVCDPIGSPCNNHGACTGPFKCSCDGGYTGTECQTHQSQTAQVAKGVIIGAVVSAAALLGGLYGARRYAIKKYQEKMGKNMEMK